MIISPTIAINDLYKIDIIFYNNYIFLHFYSFISFIYSIIAHQYSSIFCNFYIWSHIHFNLLFYFISLRFMYEDPSSYLTLLPLHYNYEISNQNHKAQF